MIKWLVIFGALMVMSKQALPRGLRNNNPGNIKHSERQTWIGQTGDDGVFVIFSDMKYGVRAMARLLDNYYRKHELKSLRQIISRYAPKSENLTDNYVAFVALETNIDSDKLIDSKTFANKLPDIIQAMIKMENGSTLSLEAINEGIALV